VGDRPQAVYIAEHGDTASTQTGQHAGSTDLPLSSRGQDAARTQHRVRLNCQAMRMPSKSRSPCHTS
jgi:broad specificity phosphatase PhoE